MSMKWAERIDCFLLGPLLGVLGGFYAALRCLIAWIKPEYQLFKRYPWQNGIHFGYHMLLKTACIFNPLSLAVFVLKAVVSGFMGTEAVKAFIIESPRSFEAHGAKYMPNVDDPYPDFSARSSEKPSIQSIVYDTPQQQSPVRNSAVTVASIVSTIDDTQQMTRLGRSS